MNYKRKQYNILTTYLYNITIILDRGFPKFLQMSQPMWAHYLPVLILELLDQGKWIRAYADKIGAKISVTFGQLL